MGEGVRLDAHAVSSLSESMLYRDIDDDDASVWHSMMELFFSISSLSLLAYLLVRTICSGIGILDFINTPCWLNSLDIKSSCEYGHVISNCFKYSFKNTFGSSHQNFTSMNFKEDNTFTSSFAWLTFLVLHILVEKGKGGQRPFFALGNEVETPLMHVWYAISWNNSLSDMKWGIQWGALVLPIILM